MKNKLAPPAIAEIIFDILYLSFAIGAGIYMSVKADGFIVARLYGAMVLTLGIGDSFHLIPRIIAQATGDFGKYAKALGAGKLITSITMTGFYIFLSTIGYYITDQDISPKVLAAVWIIGLVRLAACAFPQNEWFTPGGGWKWGIYRNIPFAIMGVVVMVQYFMTATGAFSLMWLAILISFACYLPVVIWADKHPKVGMLMMPKTCAYIWMIVMGLSLV